MILYPYTDGAVAIHNRHNLQSTTWFYGTESFRWSAKEILRAKLLQRKESSRTVARFCEFCTEFIELSEYESFSHQPGYVALYLSAASCQMCDNLYHSLSILIREIETSWEQRAENENTDSSLMMEISDSIVLVSMKQLGPVNDLYDQFVVVWKSDPHFRWSGEVIGLYKRKNDCRHDLIVLKT